MKYVNITENLMIKSYEIKINLITMKLNYEQARK